MPLKETKKVDCTQYFYRTMPLSRYFLKEAYIKNSKLYYKGGDNILRVLV